MIDVNRGSEPTPRSLMEGKHYDGLDVLEALHRVFLGKCYLCETCVEVGTFSIDHQKPKHIHTAQEFAWENLFPACNTHRCNERRTKNYPDDGLLDPSNGDRVEQRLLQRFEGAPSSVLSNPSKIHFSARLPDDRQAENSAVELDRIHNGTGSYPKAQHTAAALRKAIERHLSAVSAHVRAFQHTPSDDLREQLKRLFSRRAPYTMLIRSFFAHRADLRELFD